MCVPFCQREELLYFGHGGFRMGRCEMQPDPKSGLIEKQLCLMILANLGGNRMKHVLIAAAATVFGATMALADPVHGTWKTVPDDNGNYGHIEVTNCGSTICGTLVKSFNPDGSALATDNIGKKIIWDMQNLGDGNYGKGKIWSPDRDKTYKSKMVLNGNSLAVSGCVLGICRDGGTWSRVN